MKQLLMDDYPLMVSPQLAVLIGLNEAFVLQQIHYWLGKSTHNYDGRSWCYGTYNEFVKENFPFWSVETFKRTITSLKNKGLLLVGNYNKLKFDKTNWYSIDYEKLEGLTCGVGQNDLSSGSNCANGEGQNEPTNTRDYTETTTETNNIYDGSQVGDLTEDKKTSKAELKNNFEKLWELYPNKKGKSKAFNAYVKAIKSGVTNKEIQNGIVAYKQEIVYKRTEARFIKHGSTWFNNQCWNDDYEAPPENKQALVNTVTSEQELSQEEIDELMGGLIDGEPRATNCQNANEIQTADP